MFLASTLNSRRILATARVSLQPFHTLGVGLCWLPLPMLISSFWQPGGHQYHRQSMFLASTLNSRRILATARVSLQPFHTLGARLCWLPLPMLISSFWQPGGHQ
ncbi:hypothetical protein AVEN_229086-1 [Araneus ventricosus]|uniref:Uncharacterized protein n=1 Tax=Araneus ventricosus TaxID=182803 RepID=A0A4Y2IXA8_ARAVE|nr:hypothetical protein AVEN_229086-1 [Araneus ventricosus]